MLNNYKGGDEVKAGYYYSARRWTIELVEKDGVLSGPSAERYTRLPVPVMLVMAPLLGAMFVIFLPLIGFLMLGVFGWRKMTGRPPEHTGAVDARKAA